MNAYTTAVIDGLLMVGAACILIPLWTAVGIVCWITGEAGKGKVEEMISHKYLLLVIGLLLVLIAIVPVSATTWTSANGCWTATDGSYSIVKWNATGAFQYTIPAGVTSVDYLVIAGGGAGGGNSTGHSGGGGAGGLLNGTLAVTAGNVYIGSVGPGGSPGAPTVNGGNGTFSVFDSINATGGGGGAVSSNAGYPGGSGGAGGGANGAGGANVTGQGNYGGAGLNGGSATAGAGGGATGVGATGVANGNGPTGGAGFTSAITGESICYAGGAGGGVESASYIGGSGTCGGGNGGNGTAPKEGTAGTNGLGSGGGTHKAGGSGVIIIRFLSGGEADTTPPASITNLANSTSTCQQITWSFDVPASDYDHLWVLKDGVFFHNLTAATTSDVWSSLTGGQTYEFASRTVDASYNMNASWRNMSATATTCPPVSAFSANATTGVSPFGVQFTDASTGAGINNWDWYFWDNETKSSDDQNPIATFTTGVYNIRLYSSNAGGGDWENKTGYIYTGNVHPVLVNVKQSPGYLNRSSAPFSTYEAQIGSLASLGRSESFTTPDYGTTASYNRPRFAKFMGLEYQITGSTADVNQTVDALLTFENNTVVDCIYFGDYAVAYDLIADSLGRSNSTLTATNDTLIRNHLANATATCYAAMNTTYAPSTISLVDYHANSYFGIALNGLVLSDYVNASLASTPAQWADLGGDGLWVNDPLHTYTAGNHGLMAEAFNYVSGANRVGTYKGYFELGLVDLIRYWSNAKGTNYFDTYPTAKTVAMIETWQVIPQNVLPNRITDGNLKRTSSKALYTLLDTTNKSILKRSLDLMETSTALNDPTYYYEEPGTLENYLFVGDYYFSALSAAPGYTNTLNKEGEYNVFRQDWTNRSEWLSFTIYNTSTSSNRWNLHQDQLSFEYASHGDLLMPDTGELKLLTNGSWNVYGWRQSQHNTLLYENNTTSFGLPTGGYKYGNVSYRGIAHNFTHNPKTNLLLNNANVAYMDGTVTGVQREDDAEIPQDVPLNTVTNASRSILYPFKNYMVVLDREQSTYPQFFVNSFRFGSLNIVASPATSAAVRSDLSNVGNVIGTLTIGATPYDWNNQTIALEQSTGITTNSITWNTTTPYNDNISLNLFTAPASPINYNRYLTRISGYRVDQEVTNPQIFTKPAANTSLYRVTALLTKYQNETPYTPSELTVNGTGSAIKVVNGTTSTDYIYTGTGTSNFSIFQTDADTVFIRSNETATYALIVNGSSLIYNTTTLITNASVQPYIEYSGGPILAGDEPEDPPVASFTKNTTIGVQPATIQFTDTSTNTPAQWNWSFGDGTWDNETQSPAKTYATGGNYSVYLIASNEDGSDTSDIQYVRIYNQTTAILSQYPDVHDVYVPPSPLSVDYYGYTSKNVTRWSWWLDNQWYNGTDHAYYNITYDFDSLAHNYTIGLYTSDDGYGEDHVNTTYNITEGVHAQFSGTPLTGAAPVSVQFTDASTGGADTWFWVFGDDDETNNTEQNPLHTYTTGGLHNVSLNASHAGSFDWENKTGYVNLTSDVTPTAAFTKSRPLVRIPQSLHINDTSLNMTTGNWNVSWGDGSWSNTSTASEKNQSHTYHRPALFTISLTVTNAAGSSTATDRIWVTATSYQLTPGSNQEGMVNCEAGTYTTSRELTAIERLATEYKIAALCQ